MPAKTAAAPVLQRRFKILVIDQDNVVANTIATVIPQQLCEIIVCSDMALAEAATDLAEFDLIMASPGSTGVDGEAGLAVADYLAARNPTAITALMLSRDDADLQTVAAQRSRRPTLRTPPSRSDVCSLLREVGLVFGDRQSVEQR